MIVLSTRLAKNECLIFGELKMRHKYHEQWDERNIKFQHRDRYPSVPFADAPTKGITKLELTYMLLLVVVGAYVWLM